MNGFDSQAKASPERKKAPIDLTRGGGGQGHGCLGCVI